MNMQSRTKVSLVVMALFAMPLAYGSTVSKADYKAEKARISATYKSDKAACKAMADNARDICIEEGRAKEKVARAELEYSYTGKPSDQTKIATAKAEGAYAVAKEKCDDKSGNDKSVCVKQAKAAEVKALADIKMGRQISEAKTDAASDKRDADYLVATQKCDALAGDAKSSCVSMAKAKFGKS